MSNLPRMLSVLLIGMATIAATPPLPSWAGLTLETSPDNTQKPSWANVWRRVLARRRPPLISRGNLCAIAPPASGMSTATPIWSTRPLFAWRGQIQRIQVIDENNETVWDWTIPEGQENILYSGKPLQPGQTYTAKLISQSSQAVNITLYFQVIEPQARDRITKALKMLEDELAAKRATAEEIALQQATYFVNSNLVSDALREMYSVKDPSAGLKAIIQEATPELCQPPKQSKSKEKEK